MSAGFGSGGYSVTTVGGTGGSGGLTINPNNRIKDVEMSNIVFEGANITVITGEKKFNLVECLEKLEFICGFIEQNDPEAFKEAHDQYIMYREMEK